jgi:outer membrane protein
MNKLLKYLLLGVICGTPALASGPTPQEASPADGALTLQEAIRLAVSRAPEVSMADADVMRAGEALRETRGSNHPQVVAGTGPAYNNGFPLSIEGSAPSAFQIGLTQALFSKRNKNLILAAGEGVNASKVGSESARNEVAARTALVYCELHQARKLEAIWTARRATAAKEQQFTETLVEEGRARPLDASLARTATVGVEQQLLAAQEQARLAEVELHELTGLPRERAMLTQEPRLDLQVLGQSGDGLFQKALASYPEIRQAESNVKSREFRVEAEKSSRYPRFELVTQYALFTHFNNYEDYFNTFTRNNFLVGMSIQVPLFDGSLTSARVGQSRQEAAEARLKLERLKSDLKMSIERSLSGLRIARGAAELARREKETAEEIVRLNQTLYDGGRITVKDLLASQNMVREKEVAVLQAEMSAFQRQVELLRLTVGFSAFY